MSVPTKNNRLPKWAAEPFANAIDEVEEVIGLLQLAQRGIAGLTRIPDLTRALSNLSQSTKDRLGFNDGDLDVAEDERIAENAKAQLDMQLPLLTGMTLNSFWSSIENAVTTFLTRWLKNEPTARQKEQIAAIKVPLMVFDSMSANDQSMYVLEELELKLRARHLKGVGRFEALLKAFDLGGAVPDDVRRDILELQQVRHVYVHRRGVADEKLIQNCPWIRAEVGKRFQPEYSQIERYMLSVPKYMWCIMKRVKGYLGLPVDDE